MNKQDKKVNKKSKMKVAILTLILLVMVGSIVLFIIIGYIPVIGKVVASSKVKQYFQEDIVSVEYDIYNNKYRVMTSSGQAATYDFRRNYITESTFFNEQEKQLQQRYSAFLADSSSLWNSPNGYYPEYIGLWTAKDAGDSSVRYDKLYILSVFEDYKGDEATVKQHMIDLLLDFCDYLQPEFNITSVQFNYATTEKAYELIIDGNKTISDMNKEHILSKINPLERELSSVTYLNWKRSLDK